MPSGNLAVFHDQREGCHVAMFPCMGERGRLVRRKRTPFGVRGYDGQHLASKTTVILNGVKDLPAPRRRSLLAWPGTAAS